MKMVGDQGQGEAVGTGFFNDCAQLVDEIVPITIVGKNIRVLDAARHNVMKAPGASIRDCRGMAK